MRGIKALAAAVVLSVGSVSALALTPVPAFAQGALEAQLVQVIAGLPANTPPQQAQAAIDSVMAASPASAAEKQAALEAAAASPAAAGKANVVAALYGTSVAIGIIAANPGISATALAAALQQQGVPPTVASSIAASGTAAGSGVGAGGGDGGAGQGGGDGGGGGNGAGGAAAGGGPPAGGGAPGGGYQP